MIQSSQSGNNNNEDELLFFKPGLWRMDFLNAAKNGTVQQELMLSKMIVNFFS